MSVHPSTVEWESSAEQLISALWNGDVDIMYKRQRSHSRHTVESTSFDDFMFTMRNVVALNWSTINTSSRISVRKRALA